MSSIKTTQLHELTPEKLMGGYGENELVGLILRLKDTVLNQRRELARVQRDYDEKKMQYEAVRDRLERVDRACDGQSVAVSQWGIGEGPIVALNNIYSLRDAAERERAHGEKLYRIDVTEVEPEQWWLVEYNMRDQVFVYTAPSMIPPPGEILYMDSTIDRLMWRNTARDMDDAREKAVAAWKQAFGVEVEL